MDKKKETYIPHEPKRDGVSEEKITESTFRPSYQKPRPYTYTEIGTPNSASESVTNSLPL